MSKYIYWGALPWEHDGGAVVNYYLLKKQHELRSRDIYYGVPKVQHEVDPSALKWVNFPRIRTYNDIVDTIYKNKIELMNMFHVGHEDFEQILDPIMELGTKTVLHQTLHWNDDVILNCDRLEDIDKIVCPTVYAQDIFIRERKIRRRNTTVIPHAVDDTKFYRPPDAERNLYKEKLDIRPDQKVIVYSGRLGLWKGIRELVPILRPLYMEHDCVFLIRGSQFGDREGKALDYILKRISRENPNVRYYPDWMSPEFMERMYQIADIMLFNSGHEGFGVPLIEAQAVGAVPVTTALANHIEICGRDGNTSKIIAPTVDVGEVNDGTRVKVGSSDAVYGAVKWLLENPVEAEVMGKRGRANVQKRFRLEDICHRWLALYDSMVPDPYNPDASLAKSLNTE